MRKKWIPVAEFVGSTGQSGVSLVGRIEEAMGGLDPVQLRELRRLLTPDSRLDLVTRLADLKEPKLEVVNRLIGEAQVQLWLGWQWRKGNPHLNDEAVQNPVATQEFAAATRRAPADLRVSLGSWRWTPNHPFPSWEVLGKVVVWRDPKYAALR